MKRGKTITGIAGMVAAYAGYRAARAYGRRFDFARKVALVTGGSRGLGLVLARQLAAAGADVAICSRHDDQLRRAAHRLRGYGGRVYVHTCDVRDSADLARMVDRVHAALGPIDVLINNAGVIEVGPLACMTQEDYEQAMAIHLWAPLHAMELVLPDMLERRRGRIVNVASIGGEISVPHLLPYCASKFALVALSQGYRSELANRGVYVTTACPGLMRTGSHWNAWFKGQHRKEAAWFSLGASAPILAMGVERAAAQILRSCRWGRAQATLSLPAKVAVRLNALAPELVADVAQLAARLLPDAGGIGERSVEGRDSQSSWFPSVGTLLGDRAAFRNNERSPGVEPHREGDAIIARRRRVGE